MIKNKEDKLIGLINKHLISNIILLAILFLLVLFRIINLKTGGIAVTLVAERYAIVATIIAIPIALKTFSDRLLKNRGKIDKNGAHKLYKNASYVRMYIISIVTLCNIVLFSMSHNRNFMWLSIVLFCVYFFCRPSYDELLNLSATEVQNDNTVENDTTSNDNNEPDQNID